MELDPTPEPGASGHSPRMRVGLGAGVVLVLVAAAVAVVISAASAHPAAASDTTTASSSSERTSSAEHTDSPAGEGDSSGTASGTAFVQVVGAVRNPGVYELPAGDRVVDAVAAAGGFTAKADQASINLVQIVSDGEQIVVGARGAIAAAVGAGSGAGSGVTASGIVDINTADATGLETLDGIGPALAQRIIAYRSAHNGFRSVDDLQNVTGIGPKKFAAIKGSVST
jgi:competence protein ComEA